MIKNTTKINSNQFVGVCLGLLQQCGKIIRDVHHSSAKQIKYKEGDDPVTIADFRCQWIINEGLNKFYPGIFIIGEEGSNGVPSEFDFGSLDNECFKQFGFKDFEYELDKCTVYVDPLDATRSFVQGKLADVTCLITLAYEEKPVIGLIGYPAPRSTLEHITETTEIIVGQIDTPRVISLKKSEDSGNFEIIEEFGPFGEP